MREARRLVDFVWTENPPTTRCAPDQVGLGSYLFDCHTVSRVIHREGGPTEHYVVEEGRVNVGRNPKGVTQTPFTMPYDSMLPRLSELTNVFGPVALSASHVRFNAIRMEPTWMILGHAAGTAAAMLVAEGPGAPPVQALDVASCKSSRLRASFCTLENGGFGSIFNKPNANCFDRLALFTFGARCGTMSQLFIGFHFAWQ